MIRVATAVLAAALLAGPLAAQIKLRATLDGTQEAPAVTTLAGGWSTLSLDISTGVVTYDLKTWGLSGTAAHLHSAFGAIEVTLSGGPTNWSGASPPLSGGEISELLQGSWYVNVHTVANPNGEIRGAIGHTPGIYGARLNAAQEVPSNGTTATGTAIIQFVGTNQLNYFVSVTGMTGTAAHIHEAPFGSGSPGSIEIPLVGGPTLWSGTSLTLTDAQIEKLQKKEWYVNVHSAAFPGGQIRGQIVPSGSPYGPKSDPPAGQITLHVTGTPADYGGGFTGSINATVTNGKPFGTGIMFVSFAPEAALFKSEPLVVSLAGSSQYLLPLNAGGSLFVSGVPTPALPASFSLYMQFFGLDDTAPNGQFNVSNGVELPFVNF